MIRSKDSKPKSPLPIKKIAILGLILAANNMSVWMIFSFLPFMVSDFFPYLTTKELGYRAGILGSAFSCGSLLGNFMWGVIADKYGRRPALLLGLIGTALSALLFGFAPTFSIAVIARFLWGFLNGNIGVSKTYVAEILDDSNAPRGMAVFGVIGGVGRTIGPVIGGFLSSPAKTYSVLQGTIFEKYPYSLPCMVISANCAFVLALAFMELKETLRSRIGIVHSSSREDNTGVTMMKRNKSGATYSQINTTDGDADDSNNEDRGLAGGEYDNNSNKYFNEIDQASHGEQCQNRNIEDVATSTGRKDVDPKDRDVALNPAMNLEAGGAVATAAGSAAASNIGVGILPGSDVGTVVAQTATAGSSSSSVIIRSNPSLDDEPPPPLLAAVDGHPIRSHDNLNHHHELDLLLGSPLRATGTATAADTEDFSFGPAELPLQDVHVSGSLLRTEKSELLSSSARLLPPPTSSSSSSSSNHSGGSSSGNAAVDHNKGDIISIDLLGSPITSPRVSPLPTQNTHELTHVPSRHHFSSSSSSSREAGRGIGVRAGLVSTLFGRESRVSSISSDEIAAMGPCDETNLSVPTKKHVSFSSLVTVKVIGSGSMGFGQLKHLQADDNPLDDEEDDDDDGGGVTGTARERMFRFTNGAEFNASLEAHYGSFWTNIKYLLSKRSIVVTTSMYGLAALVQLVANEIFPLWVVTTIRDGGLDFTSHSIGVATMVSGPVIIAMQVGVYPSLVERYGVLRIFAVGCDMFALSCFFIPTVSLLAGGSVSLRWLFVVIGLSVIGTSAMWVFTSIFVLINNSCYSHERATVNGIGQTCASLGRFTGPYLGAITFAWSENNGFPWPFNYFFTWYIIGLISVGNSYLTKFLPRSIERRKREPREPRYAVTMLGSGSEDTAPGNDYDESNTLPLLGSPKTSSSGRAAGGRKKRSKRRFRFPPVNSEEDEEEVKDPGSSLLGGGSMSESGAAVFEKESESVKLPLLSSVDHHDNDNDIEAQEAAGNSSSSRGRYSSSEEVKGGDMATVGSKSFEHLPV